MNNKDFINQMAKKTNLPVDTVTNLVNETISIMGMHFEKNELISISGFGSFEVKKKLERISVNPTTGKRLLIPPKLALAFKQSNVLKDKFNK